MKLDVCPARAGHTPNLILYPGYKIYVTTTTSQKKGRGYVRLIFCDVIIAADGHVDLKSTHTTGLRITLLN